MKHVSLGRTKNILKTNLSYSRSEMALNEEFPCQVRASFYLFHVLVFFPYYPTVASTTIHKLAIEFAHAKTIRDKENHLQWNNFSSWQWSVSKSNFSVQKKTRHSDVDDKLCVCEHTQTHLYRWTERIIINLSSAINEHDFCGKLNNLPLKYIVQ